jgi:Ca-activated chloride channel homolog
LSANTTPKRIVIVSDGDNNTGFHSLYLVSKLARQKNVKIYSIGIGTTGLVRLNSNEPPEYVEDTFSDLDLKRISKLTGGKYFWVKTPADVEAALKEIVQTP